MATHKTHPNVAAAIWWSKTRMGWSERGEDMGKKEAAEILGRAAAKNTKWTACWTRKKMKLRRRRLHRRRDK